jgi:hypothetical protein
MTAIDDVIAKMLIGVGRDLYRERVAREKGRKGISQSSRKGMTLKAACFEVMMTAVDNASQGGQHEYPSRNLFYEVRKLIQDLRYPPMRLDKQTGLYVPWDLTGEYFDDLLGQYQDEVDPVPGIYRDPRGTLYEPHTDLAVPMGTREVADYIFPPYLFDKILYVEKEGFRPIFENARLAERYDMAIIMGKGESVTAVKDLIRQALVEDIWVGVLHDADSYGKGIARTLREETRGLHVEVVDLGLDAAETQDPDSELLSEAPLPTETYRRYIALPWWMEDELDELEAEWWKPEVRATKNHPVECVRVELNALRNQFIPYIDAKLAAEGVNRKLVVPDNVAGQRAEELLGSKLGERVDQWVSEILGLDAIKATLVDESRANVVTDPPAWIRDDQDQDRVVYWVDAVGAHVDENLDGVSARLQARLGVLLRGAGDE